VMWTADDIERLKLCYAKMLRDGRPLMLSPDMARFAKARGFQEGVHFIVAKVGHA